MSLVGASTAGAVHVPAAAGIVRGMVSDVYATKLGVEHGNCSMGLVHGSVPPGGGPPPHVHKNSDELFYLLQGELEFVSGEESFVANVGDAVYLPKGMVHHFRNPGRLPATILFVFNPSGPEGGFVHGGDELQPGVQMPPWGPERVDEKLMSVMHRYDTWLPHEI
jgi:mannose-6-phosphate isomerase-like protein (cupin superfamily)